MTNFQFKLLRNEVFNKGIKFADFLRGEQMIESGTLLQNRYLIEKQIGEGGMGAGSPIPFPEPTNSPIPMPSPSGSPTPFPSPSGSPTPFPNPSEMPSPMPSPDEMPMPSPTPR